jgi:multidrug efflux pump subunit AcrB
MFSKFFIDRPIFATVLALLIVVAGLVTFNVLPVAQYPEITPPTVQVNAAYPGANAETGFVCQRYFALCYGREGRFGR